VPLTSWQREEGRRARAFVAREILPFACTWDAAEAIPRDVIDKIGAAGYLGALAPRSHGGTDLDPLSFGVLCEQFGYGCASARSLLTAHGMVVVAIRRWGDARTQEEWLPRLASGAAIAAFALSEPGAGSDAGAMETLAERGSVEYRLRGHKTWASFGQIADVFLVFARSSDGVGAFLVEALSPGVTVAPVQGMTGCRASMLADLQMHDARPAALVGRSGMGWSGVAATALDLGRYSVAWGCVGLARACLDAAAAHAARRRQFGRPLRDFQLIQEMLTNMTTGFEASRLLCAEAGRLRTSGDPDSIAATHVAKYFASRAASRIATDAVQIHGALGLTRRAAVERHWRDAKVMEIIEGSTQIHQTLIAAAPVRDWLEMP
jgi:glutaryl-CoA dehydrogenase (non-decarboxylating)